MRLAAAAHVHRKTFPAQRELYGADVAHKLERGLEPQTEAQQLERMAEAESVEGRLPGAARRGAQLVMMPTIPIGPPPVDVDEVSLRGTVFAHTQLFNHLGWPSITIPCGTDADGMPVGMMLSGPRRRRRARRGAGAGGRDPRSRRPVTEKALTYSSYLRIDELLALQTPRSEGPEHDEHLFIVIHQVYELWFRQLLVESARLQAMLEARDAPAALHTLKRILTILKTIVAQVDILETMTPLSFASFRGRLDSASGFQSAQFREFEAVLGRRDGWILEQHPAGPGARPDRRGDGPPVAVGISSSGSWTRTRRAPARPCCGRTAATRWRRWCASGWSTSTRACRSGATGT